MKKIVLLLFVAMATLSVSAQGVYMGGAFSLWRNDDADRTSFEIAPEVGYNFNEKWAVGATLAFSYESINDNSGSLFLFAPYARYSFYENKLVRLFVDGGFAIGALDGDYEGDSSTAFEIGFKPGIAIKLNDHFSLVAKYGFLGYGNENMSTSGVGLRLNSEDLSLGFHYEF